MLIHLAATMTDTQSITCTPAAYHEWSFKHQLSAYASPSEDAALQEAIQTLYATHQDILQLQQQVQQLADSTASSSSDNTTASDGLSGSQQQVDARCPRLLYQLQQAKSQLVQRFNDTNKQFTAWRDYTTLYLNSNCTAICKQAEEYLSRAHALCDALKETVEFVGDGIQAGTQLVSCNELDDMHPQPDHGRAHATSSQPAQCFAHDKQKLPEINTEQLLHEEQRATTLLRIHNAHNHHSIHLVDILRLHHEDASSDEMLPLHVVINQQLQPHEELRCVGFDCACNVVHTSFSEQLLTLAWCLCLIAG